MEIQNNLPLPLTRFIGRHNELATLDRLLAANRLVTVTGPGGIGKSRLAVEAAGRNIAHAPGGVWYVPLADMPRSDMPRSDWLEAGLAAAIGLVEEPGVTAAVALARRFGQHVVLLVLDECERVAEPLATVLGVLMQACPNLRVLATSRRPIRVSGEALYPVSSLAVGQPGASQADIARQDAVALFVDRVSSQTPGFKLTDSTASLVQELVRKLDGHPLAIELAAARARHFDLADLVAQLDDQSAVLRLGPVDGPSRHHSLEAMVDGSLALAGAGAGRLLPRLAVFRGGFDRLAAEAVAGTAHRSAADDLSELVDHSLLLVEEGPGGLTRYRMLEPIRQRAFEHLRARGGAPRVERRHAAYFAQVAAGFAAALMTADEPLWMDRLDADRDNVVWALEWLLVHVPGEGLAMAADLGAFWLQRGQFREARQALERALATSPGHPKRGAAVLALGWAIAGVSKLADALPAAETALTEADAHGDLALESRARLLLAWTAISEPGRARREFTAAARTAAALGDDGLITEVAGETADAEWLMGDPVAAIGLARDALDSARRIGSPILMLVPAIVLAREATFEGRPEAESLWLECLRLSRAIGDPSQVQYCQQFLALVAVRSGDLAMAVDRLGELVEILKRVGNTVARLQFVELMGIALIQADRPLEGLRLIRCKQAAEPPDWVQSGPSIDLVRAEIDVAHRALGDRATAAEAVGAQWSLDRGFDEAASELARLTADATRSHATHPSGLSRREQEIVGLASAGCTNREIGRRLMISERTAEAHIGHILNKLALANRAQIAAWAVGHGLALDEGP